ncbi:MAG: TonB C-terminal domain-containing protein, partial [Bdellovibrionaceae bacterium]|nr:TonB C-terminal domain-containing protein [Pseudobdellovibrionaceae bacterium]
ILHLTIAVFMFIKSLLWLENPVYLEKAIRVDVIGLPDKDQNALPSDRVEPTEKEQATSALPPPAESATVVPKEQEGSKKKISSKKKEDLSQKGGIGSLKTSQLKALDKIAQSLQDDEIRYQKLRKILFKGNVIANSSSLTGVNKIEAEEYVALVEEHVKKNWKLPQWLAKEKLRAKILVRWDQFGNPIFIHMIERSGNPLFDETALDTIQKSVPLPPPPGKFVTLMKEEGVIFGFPD